MKQLEEAPFSIAYLDFIRVKSNNSNPQPFQYITVFKRTMTGSYRDQANARDMFRNDSDEIDRYIGERGFNYASLILEDHFIIITETPLEFNPLMVKLTTGLDLRGEWTFDFNQWMSYEGIDAHTYPLLFREKEC